MLLGIAKSLDRNQLSTERYIKNKLLEKKFLASYLNWKEFFFYTVNCGERRIFGKAIKE